MCESYIINCHCGNNCAELFFGKMVLNQNSVTGLFCPQCSQDKVNNSPENVWDNGWILELDMEIIRAHASTFGIPVDTLTASWVFDSGYVTWAGITPDDTQKRNQEREKIQHLAKTDVLAYIQAMKEWGIEREKRFSKEGWRKMR